MKLESLNNSKYSLTPEKMGELVGGQKVTTHSAGGTYKFGANNTVTCHHDVITYANETDARRNMAQNVEFYDANGKLLLRT